MLNLRTKIVTAILVSLLLAGGCETTDYEPLYVKKELKQLAAENEDLKIQIKQLKMEISSLNKGSQAANVIEKIVPRNEPRGPANNIDQLALAGELQQLGVYVGTSQTGGQIEELDFTDASYSNENLISVVGLPELRKLVLNGNQTDLNTFEIIRQLTTLEILEVPMSPATPEALSKLSDLNNLRFLQLFRSDVNDDGFAVLAQMSGLQQIRCAQTRISDNALKNISGMKSLLALDLSDCNQITDLGLTYLKGLEKLKFLKVWGQGITDKGMESIGQLSSLNVLGLNDTRVTDHGIVSLQYLDQLKEIHLFRTGVGDTGIEVLSTLPSIEYLNLRDTKISDQAMIHLTNLPNLVKLDLSETNSPGITDASAPLLSRLSQLQDVNLWSTKIGDGTMEQLAKIPNLKKLNLDKTNITNKAVMLMSQLKNLSWLHVGSTAIDDQCVEALITFPKLKYLNVSNSQISDEKFFELFERLSANGCNVVGP